MKPLEPGMMCMIRGVPQRQMGGDCNGKVVQLVQVYQGDLANPGNYWEFVPVLDAVHPAYGIKIALDIAHERYLHPLEDFSPTELLEDVVMEEHP